MARDRRQGLGLGLAIVKRVATMLGHPIELRSVPNKGSMFAVVVPLAPETSRAETAVETAIPADAAAFCITILVIDDDADVLGALKWLLESMGHHVLAAASFDEARVKVSAVGSKPDLIIADYRLPDGETGPRAIKGVRSQVNAEVPGIILTGDTSIGDETKTGFATLHKPISAEALGAAIRSLVAPRGSGS